MCGVIHQPTKTLVNWVGKLPNRWTAPPPGVIKLNNDASYQKDSGRSTVGAVARDWLGRIFVSVSHQINICRSVEEAEAMAVFVDLSALSKLYRGDTIVEMDCSAVVRDLTVSKPTASECFSLIHDIKLLQQCFSSVDVVAVKRGCNGLANGLAALAKTRGDQDIIGDIPDDVRELSLTECAHNSWVIVLGLS